MKRSNIFRFFATAIFTGLILSSCSNPSGSSASPDPVIKETLTPEERADLETMASIINTALPFSLPTSELGMMAKKMTGTEEGCDSIGPGAQACYYSTEDGGWSKDTMRIFSDAAHTAQVDISNPMTILGYENVYLTSHSLSHNSEIDSDVLMTVKVNIKGMLPYMDKFDEMDEVELMKVLDISGTLAGSVAYHDRDVGIHFSDISYSLKEGIMGGKFNFRIMDKYDIKTTFSFDIEKMMSETTAPTGTMLEGAIINSENEQIGTFVVDYEKGVKILDNNGDVVQPAG